MSDLAVVAATKVGGWIQGTVSAVEGWISEKLTAFDDWVHEVLGIPNPNDELDANAEEKIDKTIDGEPVAKSNHVNGSPFNENKNGGAEPNQADIDEGNFGRSGHNAGTGLSGEDHPIILDLDDTGVEITELSESTVFVDSTGDGLKNLTAWAAAGNGVLFYDADGDGTISEKREYVFTEWDPTATSDIEALKAVFDANGDGVFDASDDAWGDFKVLVTQDDGSLVAMTLDELGITSIDLTADATNIELPDGSIITGQTTFTWSDGTTGTVADTTLVSMTDSHRIEESEAIDSQGVRTHIQTGYGADGAISFVITSVTSADGSSITNSHDDNGDGVVDRVQTIETVTNPDGSETKTVTNKLGADFATGIQASETKTTTSSDGSVVTIERDSTGGGWYDQTEVRTTHADDSLTIVTTDWGPDGSVIRNSTETVSADGLVRTDAIDADGDGTVDLTITHTIVINADGSRSETIQYFNEDGSLRSSVTETVSADGQTKTITRDLNGDGVVDVQEELDITVNADGSTDSTLTVKNSDGSIRSDSTHSQSDDALTKTSASDIDGDGDTDVTTVETTVIHADDSRETETVVTNTDGSIRDMVKVTLGSDLVSSETWIDHNQDGVFQTTDLSQSVTVDSVTGERTATSWSRNADGSCSAQSVSVTSEDGLVVTTSLDADGDGDTDLVVSDVTVENPDGTSTRTITETAQDGSLISEQEITTSADGLTVTTVTDLNGDGVIDGKTLSVSTPNADGSVTHVTTVYAGDQTTVLSESTVTQSADRLISESTVDANGDGATNTVLHSEKHSDGSMTETETVLNADGEVLYEQQTDVSADGLTVTVATDLDGNEIVESKTVQDTVLNADGGRTTTTAVHNGDDSLRSQSVTTVSDDGLEITTTQDVDGDGVVDTTIKSTTELLADGSQKTIERVRANDNTLLSRTTTTISDDGLSVEVRTDNDGDGLADIVSTSTTVLNDDGSTTVTSDVTDISGSNDVLRSQSVRTTSDNGRDILETTDTDGDGDIDFSMHRVVGDDGQVTISEKELSSDGSTISEVKTVISDDGLVSTTQYDTDGDGAYETSVSDTTVLNADGSSTMTIEQSAEDGSVVSKTVVETSADGWTTTTQEDWDNDGDDDLTTVQTYDLAADGSETTTVTQTAADGSTLSTGVTDISADGRTVTQSADVDGNGVNDMVSVSYTDDSGQTTTNTSYFSEGGGLEAKTTSTVSGDGLTFTHEIDSNADGEAEHEVTDTTVLSGNGSTTRTVSHANGRNVSLGMEVYYTSDDGLDTFVQLDLDGDGLFDSTTNGLTVLESDGDVVNYQTTIDEEFQTTSEIKTYRSGDGLRTTVETDFSGDGTPNRISSLVIAANGGFTETVSGFGAGTELQYSYVTTVSADGRTEIVTADLDGDGIVDRESTTVLDDDREVTTTIRDVSADSSVETEIVQTVSADGMQTSLELDVDGDGTVDLIRTTDTSYDAQGNMVTTFTETGENGTVTFQETQTVSADGLVTTSTYDLDGDGALDGTKQNEVTLNDDGSQTITNTTEYADGRLQSEEVVDVSSDGRTTVQTEDFDGNGIVDKVTQVEIRSDGEQVVTETAFNEAGYETNAFVTTTSADGLTQTILRNGNEQTITWSAVDNGTYTWDNGVDPALGVAHVVVTHEVDALGVETWSVSREWKYEDYVYEEQPDGSLEKAVELREDGNYYYVIGTYTDTSYAEVQLDQAAKARVLEEAARIFDTVLDRDADFTEFETLVDYIVDGQLDKAGLTSALIGSDEFDTRYGTLTDAEFITQLFLNSYGRAPSLQEINDHLRDLFNENVTRGELAVDIAESAEHILVGNGHLATNNFDVILNPAQFERSLDKAYVENLIKSIIDVVYDRDATDQELSYLSNRLLKDFDNPDDIAEALLSMDGDVQGISMNSLFGLEGDAFITQAFLNAFGRQPTTSELQVWSGNLDNGRLTKAQFVATLAQSVEHKAVGNTHVASGLSLPSIMIGTDEGQTTSGTDGQDRILGQAGDDTISGKDGSDILTGGTGDDTLWGGEANTTSLTNGNDTYVWSRGDGNDVIRDMAESRIEEDRLVLTDVNPEDVQLVRIDGVDWLQIKVSGPGGEEVITIAHQFDEWSKGHGIEALEFANGEVWSLNQIYANTEIALSEGANIVDGTETIDVIDGGYGHDTINGLGGNDKLTGGKGDDILRGGDDVDTESNGHDTYYWSHGDGDDWIQDFATSQTQVDRLILTDVDPADVQLVRDTGSDHLEIHIAGPDGVEEITVARRFKSEDSGFGIEVIQFGNGVVWTLDDILSKTYVLGTVSDDTLTGTGYQDNFHGGSGNDTIEGEGGDDVLTGGAGADILYGGNSSDEEQNGDDTYVWSHGDGDDTIGDYAASVTEIDRLVFTDVDSDSVELFRTNGTNDLRIVVTGPNGTEKIIIDDQFKGWEKGYGIDVIEFGDGVVWSRDDILAFTVIPGGPNANILTGTGYDDNINGREGDDQIEGLVGDDTLNGGTGNDELWGGSAEVQAENGNDKYVWSRGDGDDVIRDLATSQSEVDTLVLTDVTSEEVQLVRVNGSDHLQVIIPGPNGDETITVARRFESGNKSYGVEFIEFSDGVKVEVLTSTVAETIVTGTAAAETLSGWGFSDTIYGNDGSDDILGKGGDDTLVGGAGADELWGGWNVATSINGNDTFVWARGDGDDTIRDLAESQTETDSLVLSDANSDDVRLARASGSNDLLIIVSGAAGDEIITVADQFADTSNGYGIEVIEFANGEIWTLDEILANTTTSGGNADNVLIGSAYADNIDANGGEDELQGMGGDDVLIGGTGDDVLRGGQDAFETENGSDTYIWSRGDGNDSIRDYADSTAEADRLVLTDVDPEDVTLIRHDGSSHLRIQIVGPSGTEVITVGLQFDDPSKGYGIEIIEFADGTIWTHDDIIDHTQTVGGTGDDTLDGTAFQDNILGEGGVDTLSGLGGNDVLIGGEGNDVLRGGDNVDTTTNGSDTFVWSRGDGDDWIQDFATSQTEVDKLVLTDVSPSDVELVRYNGSFHLQVIVSGPNGDETITIARRFEDGGSGFGIEVIEFGDGTVWGLTDIVNNTHLTGGDGNNTFIGTDYIDNIHAGGGNDTIKGGIGHDKLNGGEGDDSLEGGVGVDQFIFGDSFGNDTITDFDDNTDLIRLEIAGVSYDDLVISASGSSDTQIQISGHGTITLQGVDPSSLTQEDFVFG